MFIEAINLVLTGSAYLMTIFIRISTPFIYDPSSTMPLITGSLSLQQFINVLSLIQKGTGMKKFYLPVLVSVFVTSLSITMYAQSPFPGGLPPAAKAMRENSYCIVYGEQLWPNSLVLLYDVNSLTIGMSMADGGGKVSIDYNCYYTPYMIRSCSFLNSCLNVLVAPESSLPVKLTSFAAEIGKNNSVVLNWKSSLEVSSSRYIIQKSYDGKNFSNIGEVSAAGNSDKPVHYSFTDKTYKGSLCYFRLKQTDVDGRFEYSRTVYVNDKKAAAGIQSISSDPFTGNIHLAGRVPTELLNNIKVYNTSGQRVDYRVTGGNSIAIDPSAPSGIYFLRIKEQTFKLFKNKQ